METWPSVGLHFVFGFSERLKRGASIRVGVRSCILRDPTLAFLVALRTSNRFLNVLATAKGYFAQLCLTCGQLLWLTLDTFEQGHMLFHLVSTARKHYRLVLLCPFARQEDALRAGFDRQAAEKWIWLAIRSLGFLICQSEIIMAPLALRRMANRAFLFLLTCGVILLRVQASNQVRILSLARGVRQLLEQVYFQL